MPDLAFDSEICSKFNAVFREGDHELCLGKVVSHCNCVERFPRKVIDKHSTSQGLNGSQSEWVMEGANGKC